MNDGAYLFRQTSAERKRIASGARAKRNGSKSKSCKMPSEYMTAAQKRKLNGGIKVYQLKKPMSYEDFKNMPKDLQSQYINFCISLGGRKKDIVEMMGVNYETYNTYMYTHHRGEFHYQNKRHNADEKWLEWVTAPDGGTKEDLENPIVEELPVINRVPEYHNPPKEVEALVSLKPEVQKPRRSLPETVIPMNGTLTFSGRAEDVFTSALRLLGHDEIYSSITITFNKNE